MTSLLVRLRKLNKEGTKTPWESAYVKDRPELAVRVVVCEAEPLLTAKTENAELIVECRNSLPAVLNLIEAARQTVEDLAGDAYLYAIDELDTAAFMKALAETRDELEAAVAVFVSGQEEPK